jgi:hypothetical protein
MNIMRNIQFEKEFSCQIGQVKQFFESYIYTFAAFNLFFPFILGFYYHYSLHHFSTPKYRTISETMTKYPESIIFQIGMIIHSICLYSLFKYRKKFLDNLYPKFQKTKKFHILWKIQEYAPYPVPLGCLMLGYLKVTEFFLLHMIGVFIGFGGCLLHYLMTEWILVEVGKRKDHLTFWILFVDTIILVFAFTIPPPLDAFLQYAGIFLFMLIIFHSRCDVIGSK